MLDHKPEMEVGRFTVPYRIWGDSGPLIICVNGVYQSMGVWLSFVRHFRKRFTVAAFDFPGQGRGSIRTGGAKITIDEQAEILEQVVRTLGVDQNIHLFGNSWGSVVVSHYLSRAQDAPVSKVILASFGLNFNRDLVPLIKQGQEAFHQNDCCACGELLIRGLGEHVPESLRAKIRQQFSSVSQKDLSTFYEHMEYIKTMCDLNEMIDFRKISAKTLVINGREDVIVDAQENLVFAELLPDCRVVIVPDTGHFMHLENPSLLEVYERFYLGAGEFDEELSLEDVPSREERHAPAYASVLAAACD